MGTIKQNRGTPFKQTATHATSAVATQTGVANTTIYITDISGSSDKAGALLLVKDGTTVIWQDIIGSTVAYHYGFIEPLAITTGASASITVDGTSLCKSNIAGFIINNS